MSAGTGATSRFHPLTPAECEELLATHRFGRVAWAAPDGPMVLPVTYQVHAGEIAFRTSPYGVLSELASPTNVAFEIDHVDPDAGTGWSVLVRGRARTVTSGTTLRDLWGVDGIVPWATGSRNLFISIERHSTSGRAVRSPEAD